MTRGGAGSANLGSPPARAVDQEDPVPVSVAPAPAPAPTVRIAAPVAVAPRPGDPACVAFCGSGAFRHAGTTSLEVDLAPQVAATSA